MISLFCAGLAAPLYANSQANRINSSYDIPGEYSSNNSSLDESMEVVPAKVYERNCKKPGKKKRVTKECPVKRTYRAQHNVFYVGAFGGYGTISGASSQDGQFVQGRLAMGAAKTWDRYLVGAEVGVQSGNTMHLSVSNALVLASGGLQWLATLKPLADILVATKIQIAIQQPIYITLKAGAAYRQLQLDDRHSSNYYVSKVNPEVQAGLSMALTPHAMLTVLYQGIYSKCNVGASLNDAGNATISHIPTQQAGFIGVEYSL